MWLRQTGDGSELCRIQVNFNMRKIPAMKREFLYCIMRSKCVVEKLIDDIDDTRSLLKKVSDVTKK